MARGTQFSDLVTRVRDETGRANSVAVGVEDVAEIKTKINRVYMGLYHDYDWPHLRRVFPRKTLNAGQQYYDLPDDLNLEAIESVTLWFNDQAYPVERGIELEDYNLWSPENNERSDPVLKWDIRNVAGNEQIEVWPLPANTQYLQFIGKIAIDRLVDDDDICLLDDDLVVMFTAAPMIRRQNQKDADDMLAAATSLLGKLKGRSKAGRKSYRMGLGEVELTAPIRSTVRVNG